jgi:adenosylcobyric acid synthase
MWRNLAIPEEDSQSLDSRPSEPAGAVDVAVVRLPRIANFDDFGPLEHEPHVRLRYVASTGDLGVPDLVVVPGTKATLPDLAWLRSTGLGTAIVRLAATGTPLLGICGGYQMLGERLADPAGFDGAAASSPGLGLLPVRTTFEPSKAVRRVEGRILAHQGFFGCLAGLCIDGYEIHSGTTAGPTPPFARLVTPGGASTADDHSPTGPATMPSTADGSVSADGLIAGTYVHGLFADAIVRRATIHALARRRGLSLPVAWPVTEDPYDRLADRFQEHVDVDRLLAVCDVRLPGGR